MGATRFVVTFGVFAGCLPPPQQQAQPQYANGPQQQAPQQAPQQQGPQQGPQQQGPQYQLPEPQAAPPPPPQPAPAPQGGVAVGPAPQPYPSQAPQEQPQPQPPAAPRPYFSYQPNAPTESQPTQASHFHDGEVIADFATVGVLAAVDLAVRQDITDGNGISLLIAGGVAGGGGVGYLLTQKFHVTAGAAHSTTIGLMLGISNGALLIQPANYHDAASVMGLLTLGSAIGAAGGFIYGENAELTNGQSLFVGNLMLMGSSTALLTAVTANRDGNYGGFENTTLALGLDGGALIGAIVAPHLDWSPKRSKLVFASTFIGALAGGLVAGTIAQPRNGGSTTDENPSIVTGAMTGGLWGGFALGILLTRDLPPDSKYLSASASRGDGTSTSFAPMIGPNGQLGVMSGGTF
ncbi:MAG: hypothetical protein ABI591_24385 [Kofleriaceae bacterium]